ncbi:hypothetical protein IJH66_01320 [Candidatus Saccharibacteria bacterium]|nr:hypothetical protein [Candidatus Saccharibacteria bacterium]
MKESEENLNSDFDLKVKHDITEKLRTERPAELSPSPILSAARVENKSLPFIIALAVAVVGLVLNIFLGIMFFSKNATISALEREIEKKENSISELEDLLEEAESEANSKASK